MWKSVPKIKTQCVCFFHSGFNTTFAQVITVMYWFLRSCFFILELLLKKINRLNENNINSNNKYFQYFEQCPYNQQSNVESEETLLHYTVTRAAVETGTTSWTIANWNSAHITCKVVRSAHDWEVRFDSYSNSFFLNCMSCQQAYNSTETLKS